MSINKHISDILQLYEFAMSIGKTLDYKKNCDNFLTLLLARKNLSGCCIIQKQKDFYHSSYRYPVDLVKDKMSLEHRFFFKCFSDQQIKKGNLTVASSSFLPMDHKDSSWAFFPLDQEQGVFIFDSKGTEFNQVEINQLAPIMEKFTISLKACESFQEQQNLLSQLTVQNEELREYSQVISHDLKSPLRNIHTLISWTKDDYEIKEEGVRKNLDEIAHHVEKMDNLIKGLYTYSMIDKLERKDKMVSLETSFQEVLSLFDIPEHIEIIIENEIDEIKMHPTLFEELFKQLIGNAINSIDKSKGNITISTKEEKEAIHFSITDNGKGIPEKYHHKIFELFESIDSQKDAIGIGLPIVKKIIEYYKGTIWIESAESQGTTFYCSLKK